MIFLACGLFASQSGAAGRPKTVIDLQPLRTTSSITVKGTKGEEGLATLINLNPNINSWYLLRLNRGAGTPEETYHLQNAHPPTQTLLLEETNPNGIAIAQGEKRSPCDLWGANGRESLTAARQSAVPYAPLCNGKAYVRNPTKGHQSPVEAVTDFLRKEVPGGEEVVSFVRDTFYAYLYQKKAERKVESKPVEGTPQAKTVSGPASALLDPKRTNETVKAIDLGIEMEDSISDRMVPGVWYVARDNPGIYVSVIVPGWIAPEIFGSYTRTVSSLNNVETGQLVYLVAFDLGRFELHFAVGTVHPEVGWSGHIPGQMKDKSLPGPDGINTIAPLARTGLVNPMDAPRTVATFTGGFKRYHGAFKYGPLSVKNRGSHYGFLEEGVLLSTLQPELSTIYALDDGRTDMKTWTEQDNNLLPKIRYARQNGVPIIDGFDQASHLSVPGQFVNRWGPGNWSGSADEKLQTMRAGAALQEAGGKRFLIYAFFWSATPSAMARVFQAYQCRYAMLLDMNALVHTYLAVYKRQGSNLYVQHLIQKMNEADVTVKGRYVPRFLGFPDDRDFFYLTRKEAP
jgi:hypothetical protein